MKKITNEMITRIAEICHEANRVYCESIGDSSQVRWEIAPAWQKDCCFAGVRYFLENPNADSEEMHNNWMKDKAKDGWKYGPIKDEEKKEHPCMVPYKELPEEQRFKDKLFKGIAALFLG